MEIWVKSQDKTKLICVNYFYIDSLFETNETLIVGYINEQKRCTLGKYSSRTKANKVMDSIQRCIQNQFIHNTIDSHIHSKTIYGQKVFQMPDDNEV